MKELKLISRVSFGLAILLVFVFSGCATTSKPGAVVVEQITHTATVVNIDTAKRVVTLKREDGSVQSYVLGDNVKNFDQIKVGDIVKSSVIESVAVAVRKSDENPDATVSKSVSVAARGEKPSMTLTDTFEVVARVTSIDMDKGTITISTVSGETKTFPFDKSVGKFRNIKAGDDVILNISVAVMIAVEAPAPVGPPAL
ncbi:MAG TPA: hypothetical protein VIS94_04800 [Desulfomonilia bacterium]|jgi:exosome complex RNA-binding protein Csl4